MSTSVFEGFKCQMFTSSTCELLLQWLDHPVKVLVNHEKDV